MRKFLFIALTALFLSGCGIIQSNYSNIGENRTNVDLSEANFVTLRTVSGEASATYIFGIGGLSASVISENAIGNMFKSANLSKAQAIVNMHVQRHIGTIFGIVTKITYVATGQVIEFINGPVNACPTVDINTDVKATPCNTTMYKIGDYYDKDGKVGVVFDVSQDGHHGKIVRSICKTKWSTKFLHVGAVNQVDGEKNMQIIKHLPNWEDDYPAFAVCSAMGEGWYLPAAKEVEKIMINKYGINGTCKLNNLEYIYESIWSSTENGDKHANCSNYYNVDCLRVKKDAVVGVVAVARF